MIVSVQYYKFPVREKKLFLLFISMYINLMSYCRPEGGGACYLWEGAGGEPTKCGVVRAVEVSGTCQKPKEEEKKKKEGDLRETLDVARETMPTLHMYILMSYSRTSLTASIMISLIFM